MQEFIKECLTPGYTLQWLKEIPVEPELLNSMLLYVAVYDKRLLL